jgi:hypothetical protein
MVDQVSISTFEPVLRSIPSHIVVPHGEAPGSVSTVSADDRSAGIHMLIDCSARATFRRPSVLSCWRSVTTIAPEMATPMSPMIATEISSSGSVIPRSRYG